MKRVFVILSVGAIVVAGFTSSFGQNISDDARRHFDRGTAAVEMAKSPADYEVAIKEFKQAISLAPDWADAYFNLGKVQEQAEKFGEAIASLKEYLRLAPNASDADEVKSLINKLQYKAENTLTMADISLVLTSLSKWEVKGNCGFGPAFNYITPKVEGFINVLSAWLYYRKPDRHFETMKVDGTTVRYRWTLDICDPSVGWNCARTFEDEIEVLSKTRVKVRQVVVRVGDVNPGGLRPGQKFECELSPPK